MFSIQLFSFKKLLLRYDGLNLRVYNSLKMSIFTITIKIKLQNREHRNKKALVAKIATKAHYVRI